MYEVQAGQEDWRNQHGGSGDYWEGYRQARETMWTPAESHRTSDDSMTIRYSMGETGPFQSMRFVEDASAIGVMVLAGESVSDF